MKRVIIVHGYKGMPETNWKPWLKDKLDANGFAVEVPEMPNTEHPIASEWIMKLAEIVGLPNEDLYLIGHSLGCITILRYLETLEEDQKIGGAILVAGFGEKFKRYNAGSHDTFFDHELDWQLIRKHGNLFTAIHSEDDPRIGVDQLDLFAKELGAKRVAAKGMGHFGSADGIYESPLIRDELLEMARAKE